MKRFGKHKFNAQRTDVNGIWFDSKLEASTYQMIKLREKAGDLILEQCQDTIYLTEARVIYKPDFRCRYPDRDEQFWIEAKGFETPEWRIKLKLWRHYGPGDLEIWNGSWQNPKLKEIVKPKIRAITSIYDC